MCEAEILIMAIEKCPCLWDIYDKDYHNKDIKDLAWEQVYREVLNDWDTYTKADKENKGAELKKKWTYIRDYFRRDFQKNQNTSTGSAAKKVKRYIYADLLYFLIPVFEKRKTEGNHNQINDFENNLQEEEPETQEEQEDDSTNCLKPSSPVSTPATHTKRKKKDVPSQILNILHKNQQKINEKQKEEDDDTKFLLSFRTNMKNMNENQKLDFKIGMLQLVKRIHNEYTSSPLNYDNLSDHSTSASSHEYSTGPYYISVPKSSPSNSRVVIEGVTHLPPNKRDETWSAVNNEDTEDLC